MSGTRKRSTFILHSVGQRTCDVHDNLYQRKWLQKADNCFISPEIATIVLNNSKTNKKLSSTDKSYNFSYLIFKTTVREEMFPQL